MVNTDAMFNSASRMISAKLEIYFDEEPLVVLKDDYLIDCMMHEASWNGSSGLFKDVEPCTIDVTLLNPDRIFTPSNTKSPYHGKIVIGVPIKYYIRGSEEADWLPMGTFYATNWEAASGGMTVLIYASDNLLKVVKKPVSLIRPMEHPTYSAFLDYYCSTLGIEANIDSTLFSNLQWGYSTGNITQDLSLLSQATWAWCGYNRGDALTIKGFNTVTPIRATFTDADQIMTIKSQQSIIKSYDGVSLTFCAPFVSQGEVIRVDSYEVTAGINEEARIPFSKMPVVYLTDIAAATQTTRAKIREFHYTPRELYLTLESTGIAATTSLAVNGSYLSLPAFVLEDAGQSMLSYNNPFIQFGDYATAYKTKLNRYVSSPLPVLEVEIIGNMLLKMGDKIEIDSEYYSTHFIGKIINMDTSYTGSLKQVISLLDANIVE